MNRSGMKTAISDKRQRDHGEADFAGAVEGGLHRLLALFEMAHDVLDHDDRVVDDEAGADRQAPSATGCRR